MHEIKKKKKPNHKNVHFSEYHVVCKQLVLKLSKVIHRLLKLTLNKS